MPIIITFVLLFFSSALMLLTRMNQWRSVIRLFIMLVLTEISVLNGAPTDMSKTRFLLVHFIKTAKSTDSILLDLRETEVLIDAAYRNSGVAEYLRDFVEGSLEALIATHPHADHIGRMAEVLENYDVLEIWTNGDERKLDAELISRAPQSLTGYESIYESFILLADEEGRAVHAARRG